MTSLPPARLVLPFALPFALLFAPACACGDDSPIGGAGAGGSAASGGASGPGGAGGTGGRGPVSVSLPQALAGAMQANPDVYPELPLRVTTQGSPSAVRVTLGDGAPVLASDDDGDGTFVAALPIGALPDGTVALTVDAEPAGPDATVSVELVLDRDGVALTDFGAVGAAGTPRISRQGEALWLTYTDRTAGKPTAWLARLDGGLRPIAPPVALTAPPLAPIYARAAISGDAVGLLYQEVGNPYTTHFVVAGVDGQAAGPAIDLDPGGRFGLSGGDVVWDGEAFALVFRVAGPAGKDLLFARVDAAGALLVPPTVIASSGDGSTDGDFIPFSAMAIAALGDGYAVAFEREKYLSAIDTLIPKSQVAFVAKDGTVESTAELAAPGYTFHREARWASVGGELWAVMGWADLLDPSPTPPELFYLRKVDATLSVPAASEPLFDAVDDRDEPFLIDHPDFFGVLAWTDNRSYTERGLQSGRIQLMAASVDATLAAGPPVVFEHARFIEATAELRGGRVGPNVVLSWLDERHGGGVLDPRPELVLDTVWY